MQIKPISRQLRQAGVQQRQGTVCRRRFSQPSPSTPQTFKILTPSPRTLHLQQQIGTGSYAQIWEASPTSPANGSLTALKLYHPSPGPKALDQALSEVEFANASHVNSPYVVHVLGKGKGELGTTPRHYLEMERVPGMSFYDWVLEDFELNQGTGKPSIFESMVPLEFARFLTLGVKAMHDVGLLHLDLCPANIVFDAHQPSIPPKWIDMAGASSRESASPFVSYSQGFFGTFSYGAPELVRYVEASFSKPAAGQLERLWRDIDQRTDLFGLGQVFMEISGNFPQKHSQLNSLAERLTAPNKAQRLQTVDWVLHELHL